MEKIIIASILGIFLVGQVQAQEIDVRERLTFGLKVGANFSNVYDSEGEDFKADGKLGLVTGAFLAIPVGKYLGFQPEVLFSQKGFTGSGNLLGSNYDFTRTTNYIDIPLFMLIKPSAFVTVMGGPQWSYLIKQKDVFGNGTNSIEQEQVFENENLRKNTLGFVGGLDINLKHIVLGARAGWDVLNNNGNGNSNTPRYKNAWFQGTIGYRFYN